MKVKQSYILFQIPSLPDKPSHYLGFRFAEEFVLENVSATSVVDCGLQCLHKKCCASITYHTSLTKFNCHLNHVISLQFSGLMLRDEDAEYYELVDVYKVITSKYMHAWHFSLFLFNSFSWSSYLELLFEALSYL